MSASIMGLLQEPEQAQSHRSGGRTTRDAIYPESQSSSGPELW